MVIGQRLPEGKAWPTSAAAAAAVMILSSAASLVQIGTIALGGLIGWIACRDTQKLATGNVLIPVSRGVGFAALGLYFLLLFLLPVLRDLPGVALFDAFYRSGALVFGGGHVVLPLLREAFVTPGWVSDDAFLSGYGAAQAVPGPLFTFSAYLGAVVNSEPNGVAGAAIGLAGIFLPGILALVGTLPFWDTFRTRTWAQAVMRGVNAAVVGLLTAALYNPVWTSSVGTSRRPRWLGFSLQRFGVLAPRRPIDHRRFFYGHVLGDELVSENH